MNIVTFAAPVTIKPVCFDARGLRVYLCSPARSTQRRRFVVSLYHDTQTLLNMRARRHGVMQILGEQHAHLVPLLGKTRGQDVDKLALLRDTPGVALETRFGVQTLADCVGTVRPL